MRTEASLCKADLFFGEERMLEALNKDQDADPVRLLMNVSESIKEYVGDAKQFDDITMLAFTYNGVN